MQQKYWWRQPRRGKQLMVHEVYCQCTELEMGTVTRTKRALGKMNAKGSITKIGMWRETVTSIRPLQILGWQKNANTIEMQNVLRRKHCFTNHSVLNKVGMCLHIYTKAAKRTKSRPGESTLLEANAECELSQFVIILLHGWCKITGSRQFNPA